MASLKLSKKVLTVKGVANAKPPEPNGRREIPDAGLPSFYLIVQPSGKKAFALRYRINGKSRKWTIGHYPQMTLAQAHQLAREGIGDIARGIAQRRGKRPHAAPAAPPARRGLSMR